VSGNGGNDGDPFARIGRSAREELQRRGGKADYMQLEAWAEGRGIGKYTFRTVISDMIEDGQIWAPDGFLEAASEMEPPVPKTVASLSVPQADISKMKSYLSEFWSVGLLRLFEDMGRAGMKDANEVVKLLAAQGYVDMPVAGVVNATPKLIPADNSKHGSKLSDLVRL